jgi:tetratricopeptide (TPR) repeat protein
LERGRTAFKNQDWTAAYEILSRVAETSQLCPQDLELLAEAAFWTGRFDDGTRSRELAYSAYLDADQPERAGLVALWLCEEFGRKHSKAVSAGWRKRAERLLLDSESREYGYLIRMRAKVAIEQDEDLDQAITEAQATFETGRKFGDADLEAMGLADRGRAMIRQGNVPDGMAFLDEAMAMLSSGRLSLMVTGQIYCNMMDACQILGDCQRAGEWSEAALKWCEPNIDSGFPGICRVHRAETLRLSGKWDEAEEQARRAHEQLQGYTVGAAAEAQYEIAEIRLRRGDFDGAEKSFSQAHEMGRDPVPGLAVLRLMQGKVQAATSLLRRALDETSPPLNRARLLPAWIDVSLQAGDRGAAKDAVAELASIAEEFESKVYEAAARHGRGTVLLHGGEPQEAVKELRAAWKMWKELELPLEGAHSRLQLGRAYRETGSEEDASLELSAALSTFRKLGAEPSIGMAENLIAGE